MSKEDTMKRAFVVAIVMTCTGYAADAGAACFSRDASQRPALSHTRLPGDLTATGGTEGSSHATYDSIIGLWGVTFLLGNGPDVFDVGFQQWHLGGTETMVDNAVPPSLGNVCVGVWQPIAPRTYRLRHMTFNWDDQGRSTGTFLLVMTVVLDRHGRVYVGRYASDSFDLQGNVIAELHVEGLVKGVRIRP
jgi:hypothetical protein